MALELDRSDIDTERVIAALDTLLGDHAVAQSLEARLYANVFHADVLARIEELGGRDTPLGKIFRSVAANQTGVQAVRDAFDGLDIGVFDDPADRARWLSSLVIEGSMRDLAQAVGAKAKLDFVALKLPGRHRALPNAGTVLSAWLKNFRGIRSSVPSVRREFVREDEVTGDAQARQRDAAGGRRAYESAISQQAGILQKVREGDYATARAYAEDLVRTQSETSSPEHLAKSLCRLAKAAKDLEVHDLQLEWAHRASEIYPVDPQTHGHLADALIYLGRYAEADAALADTEHCGNRLYAMNGRARILRAVGRTDEARSLFQKAIEEHPDEEGLEYSYLGAAECLRDMGLPGEALIEYERLVDRWPFETAFRNGLASTLVDLGRFSEAVRTFGQASASDSGSVVALNGRANVARLSGQLEESEAQYRRALEKFPSNAAVHCGLGEVLRLQGRLDDAFEQFSIVRETAPANPIAVIGQSDVLRDRGSVIQALKLIESHLEEFGYERSIKLSHAMCLSSIGRYSDALTAFDSLIHQFPYFTFAQIARADFLRSIRNFEAALGAYDRILSTRPGHVGAESGKAAVLIAKKDFGAAERLLPDRPARTQAEWSKYLLRALLLAEQGGTKAAMRALERGISRSPFARSKNLMRNALALLHLEKRDYKAALRTAVPMPGDATNVIYLHALAAAHRTGHVRQLISQTEMEEQGPLVSSLTSAVASVFELFPSASPKVSPDQLIRAEQATLLAAA